jgi:hypothetical protein
MRGTCKRRPSEIQTTARLQGVGVLRAVSTWTSKVIVAWPLPMIAIGAGIVAWCIAEPLPNVHVPGWARARGRHVIPPALGDGALSCATAVDDLHTGRIKDGWLIMTA